MDHAATHRNGAKLLRVSIYARARNPFRRSRLDGYCCRLRDPKGFARNNQAKPQPAWQNLMKTRPFRGRPAGGGIKDADGSIPRACHPNSTRRCLVPSARLAAAARAAGPGKPAVSAQRLRAGESRYQGLKDLILGMLPAARGFDSCRAPERAPPPVRRSPGNRRFPPGV